jgi:hypothetical protein
MMEGQVLRVTLPGKLFQRGDRWWWSVKLPGDDKTKPRPLKPKGAKAAVSDRETAEKIAFEIWEQAVREQAQRQISVESSQKIAALKAQFLDKVRHFTEIVERATAKAEAEARARAEAEAKLQKIAPASRQQTESGEPRAEEQQRQSAIHNPPVPAGPTAARQSAIQRSCNPQDEEAGCCECCESEGFPVGQLKQIDSGQLLCPRCLAALRADASGARSHAFAGHPV